MLIREIMTTNVVTISSSTSITDAKRIMEAHRFQRLPVVDKGKLVGIVTARRLESVSPSKASSLTVWELSYLLNTTPVKEIMEKNVLDPENYFRAYCWDDDERPEYPCVFIVIAVTPISGCIAISEAVFEELPESDCSCNYWKHSSLLQWSR